MQDIVIKFAIYQLRIVTLAVCGHSSVARLVATPSESLCCMCCWLNPLFIVIKSLVIFRDFSFQIVYR